MSNLLYGNWGGGSFKKMVGFSGTVSASFAKTNPLSVSWDGTDVLMVYTAPYTSIKKGTGFGGTVQSSFTSASGGTVYGLFWDGTNLLTAENDTNRRKYSGFSSTVLSSFTQTGSTRGVGWDGVNYYDYTTEPKARKYTGFNSVVVDSFTTNISGSGFASFGSDNVLTTNGTKILQLTGFTSTIQNSFAISSIEGSMGWDTVPSGAVTTTNQTRSPGGGVAIGGSMMF